MTTLTLPELAAELEAIKVFVKALAEVADQKRLVPAAKEHMEEHLNKMETAGRSDEDIADFVSAFEALRDSY
jgi:hypothetical protein